MTKKELRSSIRAKLDGMDARQAQREAARSHFNLRHMVYVRRSEGEFDTIESARKNLFKLGVVVLREQVVYGITILETKVGIRLAFLPNGKLDWHGRSRLTRHAMEEMDALCEKPTKDPGSTKLVIPGVTVFPEEVNL